MFDGSDHPRGVSGLQHNYIMVSELVWPISLVLIHALGVCAQWAAWHRRRPGSVSLDSTCIVTRDSALRPAEGAGEPSSDGPGVRRKAPAQARTQRDIVVYGLFPSAPTLWAAEAALLQLVQWMLGPAVMAPRPVAVRLWRQRSGRWAARFQVSNELYWAIWASKRHLAGTNISIHRWCPPERLGEHMAARRRTGEAAQRRRPPQGERQQEQQAMQQQRQRRVDQQVQQQAEQPVERRQEQQHEAQDGVMAQPVQRQQHRQEAPQEVSSRAAAHAFLEEFAAEQLEQQRVQHRQRRAQQQPQQGRQPRQEHQPVPAASDWSVDPGLKCGGCNKPEPEDTMVLCSGCRCGWHITCLQPALAGVPEGRWDCPGCTGSQQRPERQESGVAQRQERQLRRGARLQGRVQRS